MTDPNGPTNVSPSQLKNELQGSPPQGEDERNRPSTVHTGKLPLWLSVSFYSYCMQLEGSITSIDSISIYDTSNWSDTTSYTLRQKSLDIKNLVLLRKLL